MASGVRVKDLNLTEFLTRAMDIGLDIKLAKYQVIDQKLYIESPAESGVKNRPEFDEYNRWVTDEEVTSDFISFTHFKDTDWSNPALLPGRFVMGSASDATTLKSNMQPLDFDR